tara:strand:- start:636 stop:794 length:159 start_codon:yes stop_codon:yes gene_type:complete
MSNTIIEILEVLKTNEFYGAGDCTEIAKGKNEYVSTWSGFVRKLKRVLKAKR